MDLLWIILAIFLAVLAFRFVTGMIKFAVIAVIIVAALFISGVIG